MSICCFLLLFFQIKALISAPSTEVAPTEAKKPAEEASPTVAPASEDPTVAPQSVDKTNVAQALVLLGKRNIDKLVFGPPVSPDSTFTSSSMCDITSSLCPQASSRQVDRNHLIHRGKCTLSGDVQ